MGLIASAEEGVEDNSCQEGVANGSAWVTADIDLGIVPHIIATVTRIAPYGLAFVLNILPNL